MKRLYVWGTGVILARVLDYRINKDDIIAFIDNNEKKTEYLGKKVIRPNEIEADYDAIVVATTRTKEILEQSIELGLDITKMIFLYNNVLSQDINKNYRFIADILGDDYANTIENRYHLVRNIAKDEVIKRTRDLSMMPMYKEDYVRIKTLELVADEIYERDIHGEVAELGVFKGDFSACINRIFPDRTLYLFDTFDGFEADEASRAKDAGKCNDAFINAFKDVNVENVLRKMMYPDKVEVRKGYFPKTADGLEKQYAFVSLDVDFEDTTLSGLEYFYPRLAVGGYIFIHDYNYGYFDCIKTAIERFEQKNDVHLCKVPISDAIGTLIITK